MNVSDEMIDSACIAWMAHHLADEPLGVVLEAVIKAAMQAAWVKFDKENPSTHPPHGVSVLGLLSDGTMVTIRASVILKQDKRTPNGYESLHTTHWMPLPEFKEVHNE